MADPKKHKLVIEGRRFQTRCKNEFLPRSERETCLFELQDQSVDVRRYYETKHETYKSNARFTLDSFVHLT